MEHVYQSDILPYQGIEPLSIPQFMTQYNPDGVSTNKVVHLDTFSKEAITYGSLRKDASRGAWGLRNKLGLQPGGILLALIPNSNDFVLLAHSTWWAGAVFAPLNASSTAKDIAHAISLIRPSHIATAPSKLQDVKNALASSEIVDSKIFTVIEKVPGLSQFPLDIMGTDDHQSLPPYELAGESAKTTTAAICFSSGTTGKIKGVELSHYNLIVNPLQMRNSMPSRFNSTVREVWFSPYCHIYGLSIVVLTGMFVGGFYLGLPAFNVDDFCQKAVELKATDMHLVPPVAIALVNANVSTYDLSSVQRVVVAAAPLKVVSIPVQRSIYSVTLTSRVQQVPLQQQLKKRFPNASICQGYGLTECSPGVLHQIDDDESNCGSVGRVLIGTQVRLVDPSTQKDVKRGEEGELWVRGPQVMIGYINDPESTKGSFSSDGWLRTGDILKVDDNGNFWVTDRLKEASTWLMTPRSFQIAPSELESMLLRHPDVIDAAICAVYDDSLATEVPLAYVSLVTDKANLPESQKSVLLGQIGDWINGQVAGYKRIRGGVYHLQTLPKTPTGKIQRRLLPAKIRERRTTSI
ncbi:hypothetical protein ABOM_004626 [Aspergillus bombycis]|uniref:AMP dependent CoA ligase n=1 Tax=Aspergillus bombycis TaxID=109264 RepID=A0A1F8A4G0_9EURO|nr:hypothetical protein ABOM_004626 [Aspergillus bombycis]OGM46632.1 hypothetical protein ABOM_004626 [Aspergillus bombycis]